MVIKNSIERLIPSKQARELYQSGTIKYEDSDVAALIWHSDLTLKDKESELLGIQKKSKDETLKRQIAERVRYDLKCMSVFEAVSEGYVYVVNNHEFDDDSTCLGFFGTYELAREAGTKAGFDFFIKKHQIIYADTEIIKHRSITAEFLLKEGEDPIDEYDDWPDGPVAEVEFRADGEVMSFWSNEIAIDELVRAVETLNNKRFENKYVELPNPFESGDIVRDIVTGKKMVVVTSQEEWKRYVEKGKRPDVIDDWSDASLLVVPENREKDWHDHVNPIWFEKVEE